MAHSKKRNAHKTLTGVDDGDDRLGRLDAADDGGHHALVQLVALLAHDSRSVKQDHLVLVVAGDADDAVARRLRLGRHDAELLADDGVDERRLAGVGAADDGDDAGFEWQGRFGNQGSCPLPLEP